LQKARSIQIPVNAEAEASRRHLDIGAIHTVRDDVADVGDTDLRLERDESQQSIGTVDRRDVFEPIAVNHRSLKASL
jgi:hypothetical protein